MSFIVRGPTARARERTIALVHTPGIGWEREYNTHVSDAEWEAVLGNWEKIGATRESSDLEKPLGPMDRLLLAKGIKRVDEPTRCIILPAFWLALRDAFENRRKNAGGDYSLDGKSERFPEWTPPQAGKVAAPAPCREVTSRI